MHEQIVLAATQGQPLLGLPVVVVTDITTIGNTIATTIKTINTVLILVGLLVAVCFFIWGAIQYASSALDYQLKARGQQAMIGAAISAALIVLAYTVIGAIATTFGGTPPAASSILPPLMTTIGAERF